MFVGNCAKTLFVLRESLLKQTEILEIIARANKQKFSKIISQRILDHLEICVYLCICFTNDSYLFVHYIIVKCFSIELEHSIQYIQIIKYQRRRKGGVVRNHKKIIL